MAAIQALGWALVHSLWQGAVAAACLASLLAIVPARAARSRYALAVVTLVLMLALPLATALQLGSVSQWTTPSMLSHNRAAGVLSGGTVERIRGALEPALPWVVALWFGGVVVLSVRLASGWRGARRLRTVGTRPAPETCREALARLAARLRVSRPVRLLASAIVQVPAVIGWWRPVILIPVSVLTGGGLTPLQLDALLAHELAHVRRHDYLVNVLQAVIETLLFYHPAAWWVSARVREEREHCCDDLAVTVCGSAHVYARTLVTLEQLRAVPALALGVSGGSLRDRIRRLLLPGAAETFRRWAAGFAGAALAALVLAAAIGGGVRGLPGSAEALIALATRADDPQVRHDAVKKLARTTDPRALPALIALAQSDPDGDVRDEAVESLGAAFPGAEAVRVLAAVARRDPDRDVQQEAVETLGEMKDGVGLPVVVDIARTHPDPHVRREAVESLRDDAPPAAAVPILREIVRQEADPEVHRKAARALAKLGDL